MGTIKWSSLLGKDGLSKLDHYFNFEPKDIKQKRTIPSFMKETNSTSRRRYLE